MAKRVAAKFLAITGFLGTVFSGSAFCDTSSYQILPLLQSTPATVRPLPLGFTSRTLLPWFGTNEPPVLLVMNHGRYFEQRSLLYKAVATDGRNELFSLPSDYPVYDSGRPLTELSPAPYIPIAREDGLFDLIDPSKWIFYVNSGRPGAPVFSESYKISFQGVPKEGDAWVEDVTGDGVPDVLVGGLVHSGQRFFMYPDHPKERGPWGGVEHPNMGALPDTDIQNFRGYDIAGNWMGLPIRKYLWWAKGAYDAEGKLSFGKFREVRLGSTDYPVQWQCFGFGMSPVVMDLSQGRYIILFSGNNQAYALPVRGESDGELRVGKPEQLLEGDGIILSANHPNVIGVADMNMDGQKDLVIGSGGNGRVTVLSGTAPGHFKDLGNLFSQGGPLAGDTLAVPVRVDWNKDGYPDLIIGGGSGELALWNGTDNPLVYDECRFFKTPSGWVRHRPADGNLQGDNEIAWSYMQPEVFDWDGDGNFDIITNDNEAKLFLYRGTGPGVLLEERQRFMMDGKPLPVAWRTRPAVIDGKYRVADDDRPCLLFMKWDNVLAIAIPEKRGSVNMERTIDLVDEDGHPIALSGPAGFSGRLKFSIADWDADGVWDIVFACQESLQQFFRTPDRKVQTSASFWMRNVGTNERPVFQLPRLITFKDGTPIKVNKHTFNIWPTDLSGDGDLDIIFGDDEGFIFYLYRDRLAWDEGIEPDRERKKQMIKASEPPLPYLAGETVFEEKWDYPNGPISPELAGGKGWASGWQKGAATAEVRNKRPGSFEALSSNGVAVLSGGGQATSSINRLLKKPVDFNPEKETVFIFSLAYSREDNANNHGSEVAGLFELSTVKGKTLLSVAISSKEALELTLGGAQAATAENFVAFNGSYQVWGRLVLRPDGEEDELYVKVSERMLKEAPSDWDLKVVDDAGGLGAVFSQRIMKYGGSLYLDNLEMKVK